MVKARGLMVGLSNVAFSYLSARWRSESRLGVHSIPLWFADSKHAVLIVLTPGKMRADRERSSMMILWLYCAKLWCHVVMMEMIRAASGYLGHTSSSTV